jgi:hypothetical protein
MDEKINGHVLTPEQMKAGDKFTELVDKEGGVDKLSEEEKVEIKELIEKENEPTK